MNERHRYLFLDGIRGIAAILILVRHTGGFWHFSLYRSFIAVDLFFLLSGFVGSLGQDGRLKLLSARYGAAVANWVGVSHAEILDVVPNLVNFPTTPYLGFLDPHA